MRAIVADENEMNGDIDFFARDEKAFSALVDLIKYAPDEARSIFGFYEVEAEIKNTKIVNCKSMTMFRPNLQLIKIDFYSTPISIIEKFDLTVCQLATDGKDLYFGSSTFDDIQNRIIRFYAKNQNPLVNLNRALKYMKKGYRVDRSEFKTIEQASIKIVKRKKNGAVDVGRTVASLYNSTIAYEDSLQLTHAVEYLNNLNQT